MTQRHRNLDRYRHKAGIIDCRLDDQPEGANGRDANGRARRGISGESHVLASPLVKELLEVIDREISRAG